MECSIERNGFEIFTGKLVDGREVIEDLLDEELGFTITLQEDEDDGEVYLHSDYVENLTDEQITLVESIGLSEDPCGNNIEVIEDLLDIRIIL